MSNRGNLIVISGPSGSGKTSLAQWVLGEVAGIRFSVSHTTRPPRRTETHGVEYYFVSEEEFEEMVRQGRFLEWAWVYGYRYGTSRTFVEERLAGGEDVLLDVDVQGARQVKERVPESVTIFVLPPSRQVLEQRLRERGLDDPETIQRRLQIAAREVRCYREYEYLLVNDSLQEARNELKLIILGSRCRRENREQVAERIARTFKE